jgi:multiple sugar transport system permease protein
MVIGVWMSFVKLTRFFISNWSAAPFAGVGNYKIAVDFNGPVGKGLLLSFVVTCGFTVIVVALAWLFGMAAAFALQASFRGRGIFRTLFLIPYALPIFSSVIVWKFMLQKDTGAVNHLLVDNLHLTGHKPFWLIGSSAFVSVVVVALWRLWPFAFLMLMAGMQSVPYDLYEASAVDGARPFRQFRSITVPMLRPVNVVLVLVMFLWTFNDFNVPYVLFGKSQPSGGDLISLHIYDQSFLTWNFGFGSAMSTMLLVFLLMVTLAYLLIVNRKSQRA